MPGISHRQDEEEFRGATGSLFRIALAPTVWAFHFVFCYAGAAVWCAKVGTEDGVTFLRLSILGLTLLALAVIAWQGWQSYRQWGPHDHDDHVEGPHRFLGHAALLLSIISFVGVVYVALPAFFITSCL
ncbi:hypothetical protein [Paracoccus sp. T5]|uniref:hypothetical protein n=1 Tax=Paracoccus sp. T5 TaxID=3402161 RepID=UPI003AE0134B